MRKLILLAASLLLALFANAQIVNIPDANFKAALVTHSPVIDTNGDGEIQVSEALTTDSIDVTLKYISDMTGIEYFTSITKLLCRVNNVDSLDLSSNTALTYIDCQENGSLSFLDVSSCLGLSYLNCQSCGPIDTLDVSSNIALTHLYCSGNSLGNIDVSNNTLLEYLFCSNPIYSLDITLNTALVELHCGGCQLNTIDVSNNTALNYLNCSGNLISSLDISNNTLLSRLSCHDNLIGSLDLVNNTALTYVRCNENQLTHIDLRNGNNTAIANTDFRTYDNPNLFCIEVDDSTWSTINWVPPFIDPQSYFSEDCTTDITKQSEISDLKIAPNPFTESLAISLPENVDNAEVKVYNILGKLEEVSTTSYNNKIIINGANLRAGVYFVSVKTDTGIFTEKVIKE